MLSFSYYLDLVRSAVIWAYVAGVAVTVACGKVIDWGTVPIRYLAYYLWAVLSFVLSPLWFVADLGRSAAAQALDLAVRLRVSSVPERKDFCFPPHGENGARFADLCRRRSISTSL